MPQRADIVITVDDGGAGTVTVAALRSASVETSAEVLPAAPEEVYGYEDVLVGLREWSASASVLVLGSRDGAGADAAWERLVAAFEGREEVSVTVDWSGGAGTLTETGSAYITQLSVEGGFGGVLQGSFALAGSGALTTT